jgi:sugar O-acyltransferase (sialic acid O-acetyltransferase NeuD family)
MEKKLLILIGGGGHCKACIDVIEADASYKIIGILDTKEKIGNLILGYPIIGTDEDIATLIEEDYSFLITMGQIKNVSVRKKIYQKLKLLNANLPFIISPKSVVSKHAIIGEGTIVMHSVNVNAGSKIASNCILNTGCNVEHDVEIGDNSHISTNTIINGDCKIGADVFIGSGSIISNGLNIKSSVIIGAGSLVLKSIIENGTFVGNPLRKI